MEIVQNAVVEINFVLNDSKGNLVDTSEGDEPLLYIQGHDQMIPGLEQELAGKKVGDKFSAVIEPKDAYGTRNENLVIEASAEDFGEGAEIEVGAQFFAQAEDEERIATVVSVDGDNIVVDLNHPLADETLHLDVEVVSVRMATEQELAHQHTHDDSCGCGDH